MRNSKLLIFTLFLCMVLGPPCAQATLTMNLNSTSVNIGDIVVITISSDVGGQNSYDWGVSLDPTEAGGPPYPGTDAVLENAAILPAAGPLGSTTRYAGYEYGCVSTET